MSKICVIGEVLFRFSNKISSTFDNSNEIMFNFGGAEYNVACNLAYWKNEVSFLTRLNKNWLSNHAITHLKSFGVDTKLIINDQINTRTGSYFLQQFNGGLNNKVHYDRDHSSFCFWNNNDFDIQKLINNYDYFYICGISFAVSEQTRKNIIDLIKILKDNKKTIIFDFNYRQKMWGYPLAKKTYEKILPYIDIAFCGIKDIHSILELTSFKDLSFSKEKLIASYNALIKKYPNIKLLASSNREFVDDNTQKYTGYLYHKNKLLNTPKYILKNIIDRIGTGDAFASGVINGLLNNYEYDKVIEFGAKSAVLKHYYYGDNAKLELDFINEISESKSDISR